MAGKMAYLSKEEKQKIRNALKIKKSLDKEEDSHNLRASSPESEEVDFKKVIHPLSYFIHDREQMIEEMFSIIKGDKLRKMLPPLLKNYTLEEIKADCLVHLLGMSKKRILAIIEGRELHSSSDSESESSTTSSEPDEAPKSPSNKIESRSNIEDEDLLDISISEKDIDSLMTDKPKAANKSKKPRTRIRKKIKTEKDVSLFSIVISDDDLDSQSNKKPKKTNRERASNKLDKILGNKEKGKKRSKSGTHKSNGNTGEGSNASQKLDNKDPASLDENDKGKMLLEILELEMRARAIRALLKNTNDVEEGSSILSDAVKSTTDAASKSDPKIVSAIAEVIDQSLSDKNVEPNDSDPDDVEIIDDIDLCVLIDDDDDISMETTSEVPAPQTNANEICDSSATDEKQKSVEADTSEKSTPSNEDDVNKNKHPKADSEKGTPSNEDDFNKSKHPKADSEKSTPLNEDNVNKNKHPKADSEKRKHSTNDDSEKSKALKENPENKSSKNGRETSKLAKNNLEKTKPSTDDSEGRKLSEDNSERRKPLQDDSKKRKLSNNDSDKSKSSTDVCEKADPLEDDSEMSKPANYSEKSKPVEDISCEKLTSSISPSSEKTQSSIENTTRKNESPKGSDLPLDADQCDLSKDDTSEHSEELKTSTDNLTWSERWAEKQNVKEVVRNSKMCANIRKRMRFARMLKQKQSEKNQQKVDEIDMGNVEESSVAHYNLIKAHASKSVDNASDDSKAADRQSDPVVETSQNAPEDDTDGDITTADHTLTIQESDPKSLVIDISDDEVT